MQQELKSLFGVFIVFKDGNSAQIVQTENYDEARKAWTELVERWTRCVKDQVPFVLDDGLDASASDPGLIHKIFIKSIQLTNRINPNNPWLNQAQTGGFSNTFRNASVNPGELQSSYQSEELMDRGFKF
jgi:hypothetical protein